MSLETWFCSRTCAGALLSPSKQKTPGFVVGFTCPEAYFPTLCDLSAGPASGPETFLPWHLFWGTGTGLGAVHGQQEPWTSACCSIYCSGCLASPWSQGKVRAGTRSQLQL